MDERVIQFRVGVVIIAAALITGILIVLFGEGVRSQYTIYMQFDSAPGVTIDTPVRKNGILIGRVSRVELIDGGVLLTADIDDDRKIREGEIPQIGTASLLGDAVVDFVPGRGQIRGNEVPEGHTFANGLVELGPLDALNVFVEMKDDIQSAFASVDSAGKNFSELAQSVKSLLGDNEQDIKNFLAKSGRALDELAVALNSINDVIGNKEVKDQLQKSLRELPSLFAETRSTLQQTRSMLDRFEQVGQRAEANLKNLEGFTGPLGKRGPELAASLERTLGSADDLFNELATFSKSLNASDGTIGKLVHDPELYDRVVRAARNIDEISRKLVPIMNNLRVFSDKIARDPRVLGVKGAISRQPAGVGLKPGFFRE